MNGQILILLLKFLLYIPSHSHIYNMYSGSYLTTDSIYPGPSFKKTFDHLQRHPLRVSSDPFIYYTVISGKNNYCLGRDIWIYCSLDGTNLLSYIMQPPQGSKWHNKTG